MDAKQIGSGIIEGVVIGNVRNLCDHCGNHKNDIELVIDPFAKDVDNVIVNRLLCGDCQDILADDI